MIRNYGTKRVDYGLIQRVISIDEADTKNHNTLLS